MPLTKTHRYRGQCSATSCDRPKTAYGRLCRTHARHKARHGHEEQQGIAKSEIKPHVKRVREWLDKRAPQTWEYLEAELRSLVDEAREIVEDSRAGKRRYETIHRPTREGAYMVVRVAAEVEDQRDIIVNLMALMVLARDNPRRFKSDDALRCQMARRLMRLTTAYLATYEGYPDRQTRYVYREADQKTARLLGQKLIERIGVYGVHVHGAMERQRQKAQERHRALVNALTSPAAEGDTPQ